MDKPFQNFFKGPLTDLYALARVAKEVKFHFRLLTSAWARKIKTTL